MIEHVFRGYYQAYCVDPVARRLQTVIHPNTVTVLSGVFGGLIALCLSQGYDAIAIFCLLCSGYCDTLDGTLARLTENHSNWGAVLDITMDRLVEVLIVWGLYLVAPDERGGVALFMLSAMLLCITSFLVVGIFIENDGKGKSFHYSPGLMERAEAFIFFMAMILWPNQFYWLGLSFGVLVFYTALRRLIEFRRYTLTS